MSAQVGITLDSGPFYGGKNLSGTVSITVNGAQQSFSYLVVQVYVASTVCIHRDDFFSPIGKDYEKYDVNSEPIEKRHHQEIYINNHTVFDRSQTLAGGTFGFETKLPEDLPPSAVDQVTNKSFGRIDFTATAKLGVIAGGEIIATAAFEYIPHMYVGNPNECFSLDERKYFPFKFPEDSDDEYQHSHSQEPPTVDEMRELLKNEPRGKIRFKPSQPWCQMRQDRGNRYDYYYEQDQGFSPLWVEFSRFFMKQVVVLKVKNFKILSLLNKCSVSYPGVRLQGRYVRVRLDSIKPDASLVPSFYSLNYRHTYRLYAKVKICRNFMGKQEVFEDTFGMWTDVLSPYVTERKHMPNGQSKRPVVMRPIFHHLTYKLICSCLLESRYITEEPEVTHTHQ